MANRDEGLFTGTEFDDFFRFMSEFCAAPGGELTPGQKRWAEGRSRALRESMLRFRSIMEVLTEGILVRDQDGLLRSYNAAAERLLGVKLGSRVGKPSLGRLKFVDRNGKPFKEQDLPVFESLRTGKARTGFLFGLSRPDGMRWLETNSQPVLDDSDGKPVGTVSSFWDITDKKRIYDRLVNEATHDPLTGLPNRRALGRELRRVLAAAARRQGQVSLCVCDLDHFKQVNDQLGHPEGDKILVRFASTLTLSLRAEDFPARLGGDEFAILFEGTPANLAASILERIREKFSFSPGHGLGTVTGTFGIVDWVPGMSGDALVEAADKALYVAKEKGRDRIQIGG